MGSSDAGGGAPDLFKIDPTVVRPSIEKHLGGIADPRVRGRAAQQVVVLSTVNRESYIKWRDDAIVEMHDDGMKPAAIAAWLKMGKSTVHAILLREEQKREEQERAL